MLKEFTARLRKAGEHKGAWTYVAMDDSAELPVEASLRRAIGKDAGDEVRVRLEERIG